MAPEQISGKPVNRTADIYAVGIVLWEAISGRRLFKAENDVETMYQVLEQEPERLSSLAPDTPPALDELVARALQKNPAARFPTARDMALALDQAVSTTSSGAVGDWVQQLAGTQIQQRNQKIARIESENTPSGNSSEMLLALPAALAAARQSSPALDPPLPSEPAPAPPSPPAPAAFSSAPARSPWPRLAVGIALGSLAAFLLGLAFRKLTTDPAMAASGLPTASAPLAVSLTEPPASAPPTSASSPGSAAAASSAATSPEPPTTPPRPARDKGKPPPKPTPRGPEPIYQRD
jgi:serine/threonine-protein kinase